MKPSRRRFIQGTTAILILGGVGLHRFYFSRRKGLQGFLDSHFKEVSKSDMARLSAEYLQKFPQENSEAVLHQAILSAVDEQKFGFFQTYREYLNSQIRNNFREGECVDLDGWILSKTEGRLFALHWIYQRQKNN